MENKETVAQMMRRWVSGNGYLPCSVCEELGVNCQDDICSGGWSVLADRIEAEQRAIIDAQDGSAHKIMRAWAEQRGYSWADGESITQWLDGRFLRLPLVDGKPLAKDMEIEGLDGPVEMFCVFDDGSGEAYGGGNSVLFHACHKPDRDSTLHLAKPKALDSEGTPIEEDDTVWLVRPEDVTGDSSLKGPLKVTGVLSKRVTVKAPDGETAWPRHDQVTHKEPDTQEKIDADALKDVWEYWGCNGVGCSKCPALLDGKTPRERYGTECCSDSRNLDLLRRQRELDARLMGGE